ncbi:MAG: nucleotidyltransferase family protein [Blautia faecis]
MKTAGIIAEYNPFHTGHEYQINYIKEKLRTDYVVIAMSGDFVQRGTPALFFQICTCRNGSSKRRRPSSGAAGFHFFCQCRVICQRRRTASGWTWGYRYTLFRK